MKYCVCAIAIGFSMACFVACSKEESLILEEMPLEVREDITFIPVGEVKQVFETAHAQETAKKPKRKPPVKKAVTAYSTPDTSGVRCNE